MARTVMSDPELLERSDGLAFGHLRDMFKPVTSEDQELVQKLNDVWDKQHAQSEARQAEEDKKEAPERHGRRARFEKENEEINSSILCGVTWLPRQGENIGNSPASVFQLTYERDSTAKINGGKLTRMHIQLLQKNLWGTKSGSIIEGAFELEPLEDGILIKTNDIKLIGYFSRLDQKSGTDLKHQVAFIPRLERDFEIDQKKPE